MATNQTPNLGLHEWAPDDYFKREEVNANFRVLDEQVQIAHDQIGNLSKNKSFVESYPRLGSEADDTERIKRAINALSSTGGDVVFAGITYTISSQLDIPANVRVIGVKGKTIIDGSGIPIGSFLNEKKAINIKGTIGSAVPITSNVAQWSKTVTISSVTGLQVGDLILISSNEAYSPGTANSNWKKGELCVIEAINTSTNTLTLEEGVIFSYDSNQSATVKKITPVENVTIKDIKIVMGGVGTTHSGIAVEYARNFRAENVHVDKAEDTGIALNTVYNATVEDCLIERCTSNGGIDPDGNTKNSGYGVMSSKGSRNIKILNNRFVNCKEGVSGGGNTPPIFVDVIGNHSLYSLSGGLDCHEPCFYWNFKDNVIISPASNGLSLRGQHIKAEGNTIISAEKGIVVYSVTPVIDQKSISLVQNKIHKANEGIYVDGYNSKLWNVQIIGNIIEDCSAQGIRLSKSFENVAIQDNVIVNCSKGIHAFGNSSVDRSNDLKVSGNKIKTSGTQGILIENTDNVSSSDNKINSALDVGYKVDGCIGLSLLGEVVKGGRYYGVFITNSQKVSINGGQVTGTTDSNGDGYYLSNTTDIQLIGTYTENPRHGIKFAAGTNHVIVANNNLRNNLNATKISIDAGVTNIINQNNLVT